jgi:hypothetical protein
MGLISRLFGGQRRPPREAVEDEVLGRLTPGENVNWWTATLVLSGLPIEFAIGGAAKPHPALIARAREIAQNFDRFAREIREFLEREAAEHGDEPEDVAAEIRSLQIETVHLCWPERPRDGMVYFRETANSVFLWRCDVKDGHPTRLGADT